MRYTVTVTAFGLASDEDGEVIEVESATQYTGDALEVLPAALRDEECPGDISVRIRPDPDLDLDSDDVCLSEFVEDARLHATTLGSRTLWVTAMAQLVHAWALPPYEKRSRTSPPPEYWERAGRWWADLVPVPPPADLIAVLAQDPHLVGYQTFVKVARQLTGPPSAVCRASAALASTGAALVIPRSPTALLTQSPAHDPQRRGQGWGR